MDSPSTICECVQNAAALCGFQVPSEEKVMNIIGLGLKDALEQLLPGLSDADTMRLASHYRKLYTEMSTPALYPGIRAWLNELNDAKHALCIATGKSRASLEHHLLAHQLDSFFSATRCADETKTKPHPLMIEELLAEFGIDAENAIMVGDTEYDVVMAKRAGVQALAVTYGAHDRERLMSLQPEGCVDSVHEASAWLAKWLSNS